jgi:hypothetical protein
MSGLPPPLNLTSPWIASALATSISGREVRHGPLAVLHFYSVHGSLQVVLNPETDLIGTFSQLLTELCFIIGINNRHELVEEMHHSSKEATWLKQHMPTSHFNTRKITVIFHKSLERVQMCSFLSILYIGVSQYSIYFIHCKNGTTRAILIEKDKFLFIVVFHFVVSIIFPQLHILMHL